MKGFERQTEHFVFTPTGECHWNLLSRKGYKDPLQMELCFRKIIVIAE